MTFLYATDLHGDLDAYEALAERALAESAAALILGGDLVEYHPRAARQIAFVEGPLAGLLARLRESAVAVFAIHGNVERPATVARLSDLESEGLLALLESRPTRFGEEAEGLDLIGCALVPPTPFRVKDHERRDLARDRYAGPWPIFLSPLEADGEPWEAPAEILDRRLSIEEELALAPESDRPVFLVAHSPPHETALDLVARGAHAGSRAVRAFIEGRVPRIALHGHLHDSPDLSGRWAEPLGATLCVNPGPARGSRPNAVLFDPADVPGTLRHTRHGTLPGGGG